MCLHRLHLLMEMITCDQFRQMAMELPDTLEMPHFDRTSFRVRKKIYATMREAENLVCLMLTPADQYVFVAMGNPTVYPVPNKWGEKGATYFSLKEVDHNLPEDAHLAAYTLITR